eukprot:CAMPEP_0172485038 /NCGR_PEP_ID=MMETSP1066-20121228/12801_1 /TAXON_ID=671091 /ORGANISM="Coscinodiscus wailesii, Strain CCMP2513" /LENGTH=75 /DNA_ID=CAMNT_0013249959 /DNA_START=31 /DNA_END=255 /DNA_ORIENTATION=+
MSMGIRRAQDRMSEDNQIQTPSLVYYENAANDTFIGDGSNIGDRVYWAGTPLSSDVDGTEIIGFLNGKCDVIDNK